MTEQVVRVGDEIRKLERSLEWLRHSAKPLLRDAQSATRIAAAVEALSRPATDDQIATEVMIVIGQYFVGDAGRTIQNGTTKLWLKELDGFPLWAIERAIQKWVGRENPAKRRGRRPQPGDISEMAELVMQPVRNAEFRLEQWNKYGGDYPSFLEDTAKSTNARTGA